MLLQFEIYALEIQFELHLIHFVLDKYFVKQLPKQADTEVLSRLNNNQYGLANCFQKEIETLLNSRHNFISLRDTPIFQTYTLLY